MPWLNDSTIKHLAEVANRPDLSGTRYEVGELLAQGGMGSVYLAHDKELNRQVAIKVLKDMLFDRAAADRMLKEARIIALKALAHDSDRRYPKADDFREDIARFLAGDRVAAYRDGWLERAGHLAHRYRTPIILVGAYLLMRVLMVIYWNDS